MVDYGVSNLSFGFGVDTREERRQVVAHVIALIESKAA